MYHSVQYAEVLLCLSPVIIRYIGFIQKTEME